MDDRLRRSRRQERRIAADHGGQVTPQSGAGWRAKNDVRTPTESWEAKTTSGSQFTLKLTDLMTAWTQAVVDHRRMVFAIEFGNGKRFVVLDEDDYIELRDRLRAQVYDELHGDLEAAEDAGYAKGLADARRAGG